MRSHLFAVLAELLDFQPLLIGLLVFMAVVIDVLADSAFKHYQIVLGHVLLTLTY